jgi:glycosyltransferase involved in cell wall biosynthesis
MTLLGALGFQPGKRMEMIAPTSIGYTDITVVIPVKNNQKGITLLLSEFLKTHSAAFYPREIIIVDNASQPPIIIPKALAERSVNVTILRCDAPGPACARNLGILHAQSEWILFTDSDCIPSPTFLSGYIVAMNGSVGYAGQVKAWGKDSLSRYYESQYILTPPVLDENGVTRPEYIVTANALVWKTALSAIGGFNETISIAAGEDIDLGFRLREIGSLSYAPMACVYHNFNDGFLGFIRRFVRYGKGNKIISQLYTLDLTPRKFQARQPSIFNRILSRIQYVCLAWGYRHMQREAQEKERI